MSNSKMLDPKQVTFRMDLELRASLEETAELLGKTKSETHRLALRYGLAYLQTQHVMGKPA